MQFYLDAIRIYPATVGAFEAIDLSAYDSGIASNASMAVLRVINTSPMAEYGFQFRHPTSGEAAIATTSDQLYRETHQDFFVPVSGKTISILTDNAAVQVYLVGYLTEQNAGCLTKKYQVSPIAVSASWQTITLPETVAPRDAQFVYGEIQYLSTSIGYNVRPTGSTDAKTVARAHHLGFVIPVNGLGQFDLYCSNLGNLGNIYIHGHILGGGTNVNGTDISLTPVATWTSKTLTAGNKAVVLMHHNTSTTVYSYGARRGGASQAFYSDMRGVAFTIVPLDPLGGYETIAENTAIDCYVYGYIASEYIANEAISTYENTGANLLPAGSGGEEYFDEPIAEALTLADTNPPEIEQTQARSVSFADTVSYEFVRPTDGATVNLPVLEVSSIGLHGNAADVSVDINLVPVVNSVGVTNAIGDGESDFPTFTVLADGHAGQVGTVDVAFPVFAVVAEGGAGLLTGTVSVVLPMLSGYAQGGLPIQVSTDGSAMFSMNTRVFGVTEFQAAAVTGLCDLGGVMYMANANGIWAYDAESDDGESIPVLVGRDGIDFGISQSKALTDAYSYVRSTGTHGVRVASSGDSGGETTAIVGSNPHGSKVSLPRGVRGRTFDLAVYTTGDNEFELTEIELLAEVSHSRRGRQNG